MLHAPLLLRRESADCNRRTSLSELATTIIIPRGGGSLMRQQSIQVRQNAAALIRELKEEWQASAKYVVVSNVFKILYSLVLLFILYTSWGEGPTYLRAYLWICIGFALYNAVFSCTLCVKHQQILDVAERAQSKRGGYDEGEAVLRHGYSSQASLQACSAIGDALILLNWASAFLILVTYPKQLFKLAPIVFKTSLTLVLVDLAILSVHLSVFLAPFCCLDHLMSGSAGNPHPPEIRKGTLQSVHPMTPPTLVEFLSPPNQAATPDMVSIAINKQPQQDLRPNPDPPHAPAPAALLTPETPRGRPSAFLPASRSGLPFDMEPPEIKEGMLQSPLSSTAPTPLPTSPLPNEADSREMAATAGDKQPQETLHTGSGTTSESTPAAPDDATEAQKEALQSQQQLTQTSPKEILSPPDQAATQGRAARASNDQSREALQPNPGSPPKRSPSALLRSEEPPGRGHIIRSGSGEVMRPIGKDEAHCSICWTNYKHNDEIAEMPCDHHFHANCLDNWLAWSRTCPLCNAPLDPPATHAQIP